MALVNADVSPARIPLWKLSNSELLTLSTVQKRKGVDFFQQDELHNAFQEFSGALKLLIAIQQNQLNDTEKNNYVALKLSCYLNLSACQLKNGKFEHVVTNCTKALALDAGSVKALYRRAVARTHLQDYELAVQDLRMALSLDPRNRLVAQQLGIVQRKLKELDQFYSVAMQKMFG